VPDRYTRIHAASALPFSFRTLLASADLIVTKPGYSTVVEAVALGKPVVYVRRYNFADEQALVDYLHRYGRAVELSEQDFTVGRWQVALDQVQAVPPPPEAAPPPTGAADAACFLLQHLTRS
jgi:UDP-N-acetylglucosamine:LPS N-acetylglucosamine transferase